MLGISTIIIVVVFIFLALVYLKTEHHARKIKIVVIVIVLGLIYFSIMGVLSSSEVSLTSPRGIVNAVYVYFGWLGQTAAGLWDAGADTVGAVGNVIKINNSDGDDGTPRR